MIKLVLRAIALLALTSTIAACSGSNVGNYEPTKPTALTGGQEEALTALIGAPTTPPKGEGVESGDEDACAFFAVPYDMDPKVVIATADKLGAYGHAYFQAVCRADEPEEARTLILAIQNIIEL